jgi:putative colanic acid biosynthesis acetyltransferase WcaF
MHDHAGNVVTSAGRGAGSESGPAAPRVDISRVRSPHPLKNLIGRAVWTAVYRLLFRTSPRPLRKWRNFLLRLFGAQIHPTAVVYPKAIIWAPWNLTMEPYSCLADDVDCYCVARITIGHNSIVSQYSYLCGASHDYRISDLPLTPAPIVIGSQVWVAADVFVGPGVTIGEGTVVGARSTVLHDLPPWKVCVGSPAKPIKDRVMLESAEPSSELPRPADRPGD